MADPLQKVEKKEQVPGTPPQIGKAPGHEAPKGLAERRGEIAGKLAEGAEGGEIAEGAPTAEVREVAGEGREVKGEGAAPAKKKDEGAAPPGGAAPIVIFEEAKLPPVPEMIAQIEKALRGEIRTLMKEVSRHRGGWFRKPNYPKYSAAIIQVRSKNVLLKRLFDMAADAIKKLFLQLFGEKKT